MSLICIEIIIAAAKYCIILYSMRHNVFIYTYKKYNEREGGWEGGGLGGSKHTNPESSLWRVIRGAS